MIYRTTGDVVNLAKIERLDFAHGCNCFCTFGSGIARDIKTRLPEMYTADRKTQKGNRDKLGTFTYHRYGWGTGFNIYTQYSYSRQIPTIDYDALYRGLCAVSEFREEKLLPLAIPWIGGGAAKGDRSILMDVYQTVATQHNLLLVDYSEHIRGSFIIEPDLPYTLI